MEQPLLLQASHSLAHTFPGNEGMKGWSQMERPLAATLARAACVRRNGLAVISTEDGGNGTGGLSAESGEQSATSTAC